MSNQNSTVHYPPEEATNFLLPVTTGCPYNQCAFCSMYGDDSYAPVYMREIELQLQNGYLYTEKVFLTGADPLAIGFEKMKEVLQRIRQYLPYCAMVSAYASVRTLSQYTKEELSFLHHKGLRLLYIGFETGREDVLRLMNKGHTPKQAIEQGIKLNQANLQFHSIILYGIAGHNESTENAKQTAKMLNQFQTAKVITMNLMVFAGTQLEDMVNKGLFCPATGRERMLELLTLLELLEPRQRMIFDTTHPTNIIKIKGTLPEERQHLIGLIERNMGVRD